MAAIVAAGLVVLPAARKSSAQSGLTRRGLVPVVAADGWRSANGEALAAARARWGAAGIRDYTLVLRVTRFGPSYEQTTVVRDGAVVSDAVECLFSFTQCQSEFKDGATVEVLFAHVAEAVARADRGIILPGYRTWGTPIVRELEFYPEPGVLKTLSTDLFGPIADAGQLMTVVFTAGK